MNVFYECKTSCTHQGFVIEMIIFSNIHMLGHPKLILQLMLLLNTKPMREGNEIKTKYNFQTNEFFSLTLIQIQ